MRYLNFLFIIIYALFIFPICTKSQDVLQKPEKYDPVVLGASIMDDDEKEALRKKLIDFEKATTCQLQIVVINRLNGQSVESYANSLFNTWGIGNKEQNNGVLILIAIADRQMRIETGYGIESVLTDSECSRIIDELMTPHFKKKNYYLGLELATNYIIAQIKPDFPVDTYARNHIRSVKQMDLSREPNLPLSIIIAFLVFGGQLIAGHFILKKQKKKAKKKNSIDSQPYLIAISIVCIIIEFVLFAVFEKRMQKIDFWLLMVGCSSVLFYLLSLLPAKVGDIVKKILSHLLLILLSMFYATILASIVGGITESLFWFIFTIILGTIPFYILTQTKGFLSGGGGSSSGSSSYSGSSSSYSDSSSSYSDSSYGGGSSGGGGASGSW